MSQSQSSIVDSFKGILDSARNLLTGEPARFIGYGATLVIVGVVAIANALGVTRFGGNIDLPSALILAGTATSTVVGVIETIRKFVYSPNTVQVIAAKSAETGIAVVPPPPASDLNTDVSSQGNG